MSKKAHEHDKQEHEHETGKHDKHETGKHEKHEKHETDHADEIPAIPAIPAIMAQVVETFHIQSIAKKTHDARSPLLTTKNFAIATMCIKSGDKVEERALAGEKIYLVARGEGAITMGATTTSLDKGEMIVIPAGQAHTLHADDDDDFKLIAIESVHTDLHPVPVVATHHVNEPKQTAESKPTATEPKAKVPAGAR